MTRISAQRRESTALLSHDLIIVKFPRSNCMVKSCRWGHFDAAAPAPMKLSACVPGEDGSLFLSGSVGGIFGGQLYNYCIKNFDQSPFFGGIRTPGLTKGSLSWFTVPDQATVWFRIEVASLDQREQKLAIIQLPGINWKLSSSAWWPVNFKGVDLKTRHHNLSERLPLMPAPTFPWAPEVRQRHIPGHWVTDSFDSHWTHSWGAHRQVCNQEVGSPLRSTWTWPCFIASYGCGHATDAIFQVDICPSSWVIVWCLRILTTGFIKMRHQISKLARLFLIAITLW